MDLWTYADFLSLKNNRYLNGGGNMTGALYHIDNMYKSGVRMIILTPRFDYGAGKDNAQRLFRAEKLGGAAQLRYPGLAVRVGSRIKYFSGAPSALRSGEARGIGGGRYLMLEFDKSASLAFMLAGIREFFDAGYRPLIENPLFYDEVDADAVGELVWNGAYTVWDTAVFEGKLHRNARKQLDQFFEKKLIHFVSDGTDGAAETDYRTAAKNAAALYGDDVARRIFYENYAEIIRNGRNIIPS